MDGHLDRPNRDVRLSVSRPRLWRGRRRLRVTNMTGGEGYLGCSSGGVMHNVLRNLAAPQHREVRRHQLIGAWQIQPNLEKFERIEFVRTQQWKHLRMDHTTT